MPQPKQNNKDLLRYAGLGMQIFAALGIAVFAGYKGDDLLKISFPFLVLVLPLAVLCIMIYKLIKETSKRKSPHDKERV